MTSSASSSEAVIFIFRLNDDVHREAGGAVGREGRRPAVLPAAGAAPREEGGGAIGTTIEDGPAQNKAE